MRILSLHSHKGGAGKTSLALVLARGHLAAGEQRVVVLDELVGEPGRVLGR